MSALWICLASFAVGFYAGFLALALMSIARASDTRMKTPGTPYLDDLAWPNTWSAR